MASGAGGEDQGQGDHGGLSASGPATPAPPPSKGKHIVPPTLGCKVLLIRSGLKAAGRRAERAGGSPAAERLGKAREKQPEGSAGRAFTFPGFLCFSPTALSNRQWLDFFMPLRGWAKTRRCGVWGVSHVLQTSGVQMQMCIVPSVCLWLQPLVGLAVRSSSSPAPSPGSAGRSELRSAEPAGSHQQGRRPWALSHLEEIPRQALRCRAQGRPSPTPQLRPKDRWRPLPASCFSSHLRVAHSGQKQIPVLI